jgi:hypothetical protein
MWSAEKKFLEGWKSALGSGRIQPGVFGDVHEKEERLKEKFLSPRGVVLTGVV